MAKNRNKAILEVGKSTYSEMNMSISPDAFGACPFLKHDMSNVPIFPSL